MTNVKDVYFFFRTVQYIPYCTCKSTVKVSFLKTGEIFSATKTIVEKLKKESSLMKETSIQKCDVIIVFCPVSSRAGSDVDAAMRNPEVSGNKKVFLVVMHHTRHEDHSTEGGKWSKKYRIMMEFNVLFHETKPGLLRCEQNVKEIGILKKVLHDVIKHDGTR